MTKQGDAAGTATLIRRQELLERGLSSNAIDRERSAGRLTAIRRGVYTPTGAFAALGLELRHTARAAAVAMAAPGLVISHISAAVLHQLPVRPSGLARVHATRISTSGGIGDDRRVVHIGRLLADDIVEINGVRTTSLARTLVDLARTESFEAGVIAADSAFHSQPNVVDQVASVLARSRRHRGHTIARQALMFADGRSESVGESRLRVFLADGGFTAPQLQCQVVSGSGTVLGRVDLADLKSGTLLEFDGMAKYGKLLNPHRTELEVLRLEKKREEALREAGWQVFRVVWADLSDTAALQRRIIDAFERGRRALAANPVAGSVRLLPPIRLRR
jgi:predicted transcriptional regulator of viral defense system